MQHSTLPALCILSLHQPFNFVQHGRHRIACQDCTAAAAAYICLYCLGYCRAKFRVNAANRTEAFCSLDGLPSDLLVRGDVNQNRAVEGDEVAVLAFKLQDWFKVYKEQDKVCTCKGKEDLCRPGCLEQPFVNIMDMMFVY